MKRCKPVVFILLLFLTTEIACQTDITDTVFHIRDVNIVALRLDHFTSGNKIRRIDSSIIDNFSSTTLADLLTRYSQVTVNSYGPGGLSNVSFRGAGTSHTAVLWNGFNIQSPTDGGVNMALIPVFFLDDVKLQYGGSGALFGSGAIGGIIHLNNKADFNKGLSVNINSNYSSFGSHQESAAIRISNNKWVSSVKGFYHKARNDFPFKNTAQFGSPQVYQTNSCQEQYGLFQENYIKLNNKQQISTYFWYQNNYRQIPPSMTQMKNTSWQKDEFFRGVLEWKKTDNKLSLFGRSAYFYNEIYYHDPLAGITSLIKSISVITETEGVFKPGKVHEISIGANNSYDTGITANYNENKYRNRFALFSTYKIKNISNSWKALVSIREEMIDKKIIPFTWSAGSQGKILKNTTLNVNISRNYRVPTFNDLYWEAGGNEDLRPESGYSEEIGINFNKLIKKIKTDYRFAIFNSIIRDWIIWLPSGSIWSPDNVHKVWSRGIENDMSVSYDINKFNISLSGLYSYILSTNREADQTDDGMINKQLIYVPVHKGNTSLFFEYSNNYLCYDHSFTGKRYTTADNTGSIDPYHLGNLTIGKKIQVKETNLCVRFSVNNIWNEVYQVMTWYAMPLRNYQVGLSMKFTKPL